MFKKIIRYLIPMCSLSLIAYSAWNLYTIRMEYKEGTDLYEGVSQQYTKPRVYNNTKPSAPAPEEEEKKEGVPIEVDFDTLKASNSDVIGWIYGEDTIIDYPVVQADDNSYYLRRMLNGKYNKNGTIFMDYRNSSDLSDFHTIIYGHNMKNNAMFGTLTEYASQEYYDKHPVLWLLTPDKNYQIELIGGFITPADSEIYSFPTTVEGRDKLISIVCKKSNFKSEVEICPEDRIVTLSTCTYEYDDARYVLTGVLREYTEELQ